MQGRLVRYENKRGRHLATITQNDTRVSRHTTGIGFREMECLILRSTLYCALDQVKYGSRRTGRQIECLGRAQHQRVVTQDILNVRTRRGVDVRDLYGLQIRSLERQRFEREARASLHA